MQDSNALDMASSVNDDAQTVSQRTETTQHSSSLQPGTNRQTGFNQVLSALWTKPNGKTYSASSTVNVAYTLDETGAITGDGLRSFTMDATGRLSAVQRMAQQTRYLHNAQGQRVFKSETREVQGEREHDESEGNLTDWLRKLFNLKDDHDRSVMLGTSFVYDEAGHLIGQYGNGGSNSAETQEIIWLPIENGNAIPVGLVRNNRLYAIHTDHLGTPRRITDDTGQAVWQWPLSAFGDNAPTGLLKEVKTGGDSEDKKRSTPASITLKATTPEIEFNLRYPGQYYDSESNLNYNYYRSYNASQGRYTQPDPIGLGGGMNRFGYVGGNALSFVDPTGLVWIYQQSTGNLYHQPTNPSSLTLVGTGYAGHGVGVNNPALEGIPNVGPIPQGNYTIGPQQTIKTSSRKVLPGAMRLVPDADNWMFGRGGFIIHGGDMQSRTSSEGCIIQLLNIRNQIGNSGDRSLRVVP